MKAYNAAKDIEIANLKAEITNLRSSQEFVSTKYDNMKEYEKKKKLQELNAKQTEEFNSLHVDSVLLEKKSESESAKLDEIDQYNRRQNLEFHSVPLVKGENAIDVVVKLSKSIGVEIESKDISIAHRLAPKKSKNPNSSLHGNTETEPPGIIVRFINRDLRNEIYRKRVNARRIAKEDFLVEGMEKLYVNKNLTQVRKQLLWLQIS